MAASLLIWVLRRPDQLLHPYVWADEYHVLNRYQAHGLLAAALAPVKGYFIWPTSFTVAVAAWASFLHLPLIEYWCATAWALFGIGLLVCPRSALPSGLRALMALLLVLSSMSPEVFGVALYSFWWVSLWPAIVLVWADDHWWLRGPVLVLGGMSSLAGAAMVFPYALLAIGSRKRRDIWGTAVLAVTAVVQACAYATSSRAARTPVRVGPVAQQVLRTLGFYVLPWAKHPDPLLLGVLGALLLGFLAINFAAKSWRPGPPLQLYSALALALIVVDLLCAVPAPLSTSPGGNAPRYYFLPFVLLSWLLLLLAYFARRRWGRVLAAALVAVSLVGLVGNFARHEPTVSWSQQLSRCAGARGSFYVPVQYTGVPSQMWVHALVVTEATCRNLGYKNA